MGPKSLFPQMLCRTSTTYDKFRATVTHLLCTHGNNRTAYKMQRLNTKGLNNNQQTFMVAHVTASVKIQMD